MYKYKSLASWKEEMLTHILCNQIVVSGTFFISKFGKVGRNLKFKDYFIAILRSKIYCYVYSFLVPTSNQNKAKNIAIL